MPSRAIIAETRRGSTSRPPLMAAATALTIWIGVTLIACPNDCAATSTGDQSGSVGRRTMPLASPLMSISVALPKPKASRYWWKSATPSFSTMNTAPVLMLCWSTPVIVCSP